jgi:hypothetical protein
MSAFDQMVKILVTYSGKPLSLRYKILGKSGLEATAQHSDKYGYF